MVNLTDPNFIQKHVNLVQQWPIKHMVCGGGTLPDTPESAALWYFLGCAFQALAQVPSQVTYEGDLDQQVDLMQLAHSIRKLYELDDLEGMFADGLIAQAKLEARRSKMGWDSNIDAFFVNGGRKNNVLDRNPDKL